MIVPGLQGFVLSIAAAAASATIVHARPLVAVVEAIENAPDGSQRRGCLAQVPVDGRRKMWLSIGAVKPGADGNWEPAASRVHCGDGTYDAASTQFGKMLGTPYLIVDLEMVPAVAARSVPRLEGSLTIRKLSGFDRKGAGRYAVGRRKRRLEVAGEADAVFTLLGSSEHEEKAFGAKEIFLRLAARDLGDALATSYGAVSVTADFPGAEILLDGGFVGRTSQGGPLLLTNVLAGKREIRVRDFSGREAHEQVIVEKDRTTVVELAVLKLSPFANGLVPIGKNPQGYDEYWRMRDGAMVVRIPEGEFVRGSREGDGEPAERPQHKVLLTDFLIDKIEVTWRQLRSYAEATGASLPEAPAWGMPEDYPASNVVWEEAKRYCEWAGGRLPTEAEWEKAARGADGRTYSWGNAWDPGRCNSWDGGPHRPESVGSFPGCLSPYGVLDMLGSVWEWCADWYGEGAYASSEPRNPTGPGSGTARVLRGGYWNSQPTWLRAALRYKTDPDYRNMNHGFRCASAAPSSP